MSNGSQEIHNEAPDPILEDVSNQPTAIGPDSLACNGCRRAKLRCSRDRPSCIHCRKTGLVCVYETKRVKPGLKAGAVENLHKRLDALERMVQGQEACGQRSPLIADNDPVSQNGPLQDLAAYDILALLAKELPKFVNAQIHRSTSHAYQNNEQSPKRRRVDCETDQVIINSLEGSPILPTQDLLEIIISAYFAHIHPCIPMIHQARFRQRLGDVNDSATLDIILHAMIVSSSKFVPHANISPDVIRDSRKWIVSTAMELICLEGLQALIILAFTDIGNGNAVKAWSLIGSLTRTVEYSQLSQEHEDSDPPFCRPYNPLDHTADWTELEERRRVFWNVFNLDRFCNITMGWNTSLTSDDVHRRLPCDGPLWRKQQPVVTPFFGIWDRSAGRIGNPITFIPHYESPGQSNHTEIHNMPDTTSPGATNVIQSTDMATVGAFAYCVEATESMSRVTSYFLQQKINLCNQSEISAWLTRFKELDLRLVHWKMLLPQKWKTNMERQSTLMDPNLTTAHVTHNASMILLHQLIGYPPTSWGFRHRLPSSCSADTCLSAGVEIATITRNFLDHSTAGSPIGSQYAFCVFIAARMLLIHWRYYAVNQPPEEFWSLIQSLEEMSKRWRAFSTPSPDEKDLAAKYAMRLKNLYETCARDYMYRINVMDYTKEIDHSPSPIGRATKTAPPTHIDKDVGIGLTQWQAPMMQQVAPDMNLMTPNPVQTPLLDTGEFNTIPQMILDQQFMNMDRVITFDDGSMFAAEMENGTW